jgi:hypothetical protein
MSEAPERIWAITEPDDISADILGEVYAQQIPDGMYGTPVEYVRADRIEELERAVRYEADIAQQALDSRKELQAKLFRAEGLLVDAMVQLENGKIKTRRNCAYLIGQFLAELKGEADE